MRSIIAITIILITVCGVTIAQEQETITPIRQLNNVEIIDLNNQPAVIPKWGEKNLLIFYIDPDRAGQNRDFTDYLEETRRLKGDNLFGMGVINLKDAPFIPKNGLARIMADKRTERNGATVLADATRTLAQEWELGDCNNMFVVLLINRKGELLFVRKGVLSEEDKSEFLRVADTLK